MLPWNLAVLARLLYARWTARAVALRARWTVHVRWNLYARWNLPRPWLARWTARPLDCFRVAACPCVPAGPRFLLGSAKHLDALLV